MADRTSRRRLSRYVAAEVARGNDKVMSELAAYLIENSRTKEVDLIVRDIEVALAAHGTVIADVTTVNALSAELKADIQKYVKGEQGDTATVVFREHIDRQLIGGVKVAFAGHELDASIRHKLTTLKQGKIG